MTMVWVVSRSRLKGPSWYLISLYITPHAIGMGVPTSEVGYTSATARKGEHESSYERVVALEEKNIYFRAE